MKWNKLEDKKPRNGSSVYFLTHYCQGITFARVRLGEVVKQDKEVYFATIEDFKEYPSRMVDKWIYEKDFLKSIK